MEMEDSIGMEEDDMEGEESFIKMPALGRRFQLGDFYDYRNDSIISDGPNLWEASDVAKATRVKSELQLDLDIRSCNNWQNMDLEFEGHLQMSIMAGLINSNGASRYLNDRPNPSKANRTLVCHVQSKEEHLDLKALINRVLTFRFGGLDDLMQSLVPDATHIVVGVIYGADAYCAMSKDLKDDEDPEVTGEYLYRILLKMWFALEDKKTVSQLMEELDNEEKQFMTRLYADFQEEAVYECEVPIAYQRCLNTIEKATSEPIPIAVLLLPLKDAVELTGDFADAYEYRDVGFEACAEMFYLYTELEEIMAKANALYASALQANQTSISDSLCQFGITMEKYQEMMKNTLKEPVLKARKIEDDDEEIDEDDYETADDDVEEVCDIVEYHTLFKASRLERWLRYKKTELEIAMKIANMNEATVLASRDELKKELGKKKHSIVLTVPPLDELTNDILDAMKEYVYEYTKLEDGDQLGFDDSKEEDAGTSWHKLQEKQTQVLAMINELVHYGNEIDSQVQIIVILDKGATEGFFSIYEENTLVSGKLDRLAGPPKHLRFLYEADGSTEITSSFLLEWDKEEFVYPCHFVVEFRLKGSFDEWKQMKTEPGETRITVKGESPMEVRVAVESCLGRSEFAVICATTPADDAARVEKERKEAEAAAARARERELAFQRRMEKFMEQETERLRKLGFC